VHEKNVACVHVCVAAVVVVVAVVVAAVRRHETHIYPIASFFNSNPSYDY
jgi:hypothetical protein